MKTNDKRNRVLALFSILVVCFLGTHCNPDSNHHKESREPVRQSPLPVPPKSPTPDNPYRNRTFQHQIQDRACQQSDQTYDLEETPVQIWLQELTVESLGEGATSSSVGLQSNGINTTRFGLSTTGKVRVKIDELGYITSVEQDGFYDVINPGQALQICQNQLLFPRKSYEAAALSASKILQTSLNRLRTLDSYDPLPGLRLEVFPEMTLNYQIVNAEDKNFRIYLTDNAAFSLIESQPTILIFPRSIEELEKGFFPKFDLWESALVISHEFGHHVLNHYQKAGRPSAWKQPSLPILGNGYAALADDASRIDSTESMYMALSEGFADLFSYYVNQEPDNFSHDHTCMTYSRDIKSVHFSPVSVDKKVLTSKVLSTYFSGSPATVKPCQAPFYYESADYSDAHIIGAIFAHTVDQLLGSLSSDQKLNILLDWAKTLNLQQESGWELAHSSIEIILDQVDSVESCAVLKKLAPALVQNSPYLINQQERWPNLSSCLTETL